MKVITARSKIRALPDALRQAWRKSDGSWARILQAEPDTEKIHATVSALDLDTASVEDVHVALGFTGWITETKCHECGKIKDAVVQLGEEPDYESHTAEVCFMCLQKAVAEVRVVIAEER